jgi:hypothetical protein
MLTGGFEGWKDRGLPVEAYTEVFHLDTDRAAVKPNLWD